MCIRDRANGVLFLSGDVHYAEISRLETDGLYPIYDITSSGCLLYTSDAADERSSVDLGGRRIIKKKKKTSSCTARYYILINKQHDH